MITIALIIYMIIFCILYFKFKIHPSQCISPIYAIPEKYRKFSIAFVFLCVVASLFIEGLTAPLVLFFLGISYLIEFIYLKTHKARYYALLNSVVFVLLLISTLPKIK